MARKFFSNAWMTVAGAPGVGSVTVRDPHRIYARTGEPTDFLSFAAAGMVNGDEFSYRIQDKQVGWEEGFGSYTAGVVTRVEVKRNSKGTTAKLPFTANATIAAVLLPEDLSGIGGGGGGEDLAAHIADTNNPHEVTKEQVGLGNVDNTSDADKPVSSATQTALDGKADVAHTQAISTVTGLQTALDTINKPATALHEFKRMGQSGARIRLDLPSGMEDRIIQGFTFVPQTGEFYYVLPDDGTDWVDKNISVVRSDKTGAVIDNSTDELLTLGHGQDLNHLYYLGTLTFLCQNTDGDGMTAFTYATGGNPIANKRQYKLTNAGSNHHTTIGLSANKRFVVATWSDPDRGNDTYARIFDVVSLLAGSTGDRSSEYVREICLSDSADYDGSAENNQQLQSCTMDDHYVYTLNGYWQIEIAKYLYAFRISDGMLVHKQVVDSGKSFAATLGTGTTYEPEGLEWIQPTSWLPPALYMGWRGGGAPYNNWVVPINDVFGGLAINGDRAPLGIGLFLSGGSHDIVWRKTNILQFSVYNADDGDPAPSVSVVATMPDTGEFQLPALRLKDTNASHDLRVVAGSDLTADRTLTVVTGDADKSVDVTKIPFTNQANTFTSRQTFGNVNLGSGAALTISGGAITPTAAFHVVDTEASAASDDLDTISGGNTGDLLIIRPSNASRTIVVKHATGNIQCGSDKTLDNNLDTIVLIKVGTNWSMLAFADNGA